MSTKQLILAFSLVLIIALGGCASPDSQQSTPSAGSANPATASADDLAIEEARANGESMWLLFRSATCAPCVEMQKIYDQIEPKYRGKVHFISIDVDNRDNMDLVRRWNIQYIPASFIINDGGTVNYQVVGAIPVEDLEKELDKVVK